jgi:hypothetical protein
MTSHTEVLRRNRKLRSISKMRRLTPNNVANSAPNNFASDTHKSTTFFTYSIAPENKGTYGCSSFSFDELSQDIEHVRYQARPS